MSIRHLIWSQLELPLVLAVGLCSCEGTGFGSSVGCDSIRDCPLDQYCDVPSRSCIDESKLTNAAVGRFRCTIGDSGEPYGDSDIIARTDRDGDGSVTFAERWSFPTLAICSLSSSGQLVIGGKAWGAPAALWFSADADQALSSTAPLLPAAEAFSANSAFFYDYDANLAWAYAVSGQVALSGNVAPGSVIEGYLQTDLRPVARYVDQVAYGVPCLEGMLACGGQLDVRCLPLDETPICSGICGCDRECKPGGGICVKSAAAETGICLRPCSSNADCVAPLRCVTKEGTNVCA